MLYSMSTIYAHMFQKNHNSNCSEKAFFRDDREKAFVPFSMQLSHTKTYLCYTLRRTWNERKNPKSFARTFIISNNFEYLCASVIG